MDSTTVVLAISAVAGPLVSVLVAHWMMATENKRRDASLLFRQTIEDVTQYRDAVLRVIMERKYLLSVVPPNIARGPGGMIHPEAKIPPDYKESLERYEEAKNALKQTMLQHGDLKGKLRADIFSMRLIFGEAARKCSKELNELIAIGEESLKDQRADLQDVAERTRQAAIKITDQLEDLYRELQYPDPDLPS